MSHLAVTLEDLLADYEATSARWNNFFTANPAAALVPTDIARAKDVGELVWHIHAASFRLAQRLLGEELTGPDPFSATHGTPAAFALGAEAVKKLGQFLASASEATLEEQFEFKSRLTQQPISGTKRKLYLHVMVHAIRHWAQIATIVRRAGFPPDWGQDILFSEAIR
jgi:uncharacterized damage-inducible protein DinB